MDYLSTQPLSLDDSEKYGSTESTYYLGSSSDWSNESPTADDADSPHFVHGSLIHQERNVQADGGTPISVSLRRVAGSPGPCFVHHEGDVNLKALHNMTIIPVADEHGHLAHYPGEEEDHHLREKYIDVDETKTKEPSQSIVESGIEGLKCLFSMAFLFGSMYVCTAAIVTQQTIGTANMSVGGRATFITIFWALVLWLAEMEGSQSCLVGLQPIDKKLFRETHPHSYKTTCLAHKGDNMERFIVGRQFLIVLVVFITNIMAYPLKGISLVGVNDHLTNALLGSGVAVTACAVMLGQVAQINAANCMLDFVNNYFGLFTTYVSLFMDATGLLHSVYLVQILFAKITKEPIESSEPPRNFVQSFFFWARVIFSCVTLGYFCALTLSAVYHGETTNWPGLPDFASVISLIILLIFVGLLEGMQIALFAVVNLPPDEMAKHPTAAKSCDLTFCGNNLPAFLLGRQICVTLCMFIVARITTCDVDVFDGEDTVFHVSDRMQEFFNTGLPGAVITSIIGSLAWRIIASSFPVAFLELPLIYPILRLCLVVEASGICSVTWLLALIHKKMMRYKVDEVYIGTPEERAASAKEDSDLA